MFLLVTRAAFIGLTFSCGAVAETGVFLASRDSAFTPDLLQELESVIGRDYKEATERRVERLEYAMRHMYESLPKDANGRLGATGVRYMLRRLFVQRHGWFVHGLEHGGEAWNSSSPTAMIGQHFGEDVETVFEGRLQNHGFSLHHAAVLAATLESFVHSENLERLQASYAVLGVPRSEATTETKVNLAMRAYMLMYMRGLNHTGVTPEQLKKTVRTANRALPFWSRTKDFLEGTRQSVLADDEDAQAEPASWATTVKVLERIGERYGHWQDTECQEVKGALVKMELPGTGRVPLDRFYNMSWQFVESVDYLRQLGALDDQSDPSRWSVIIPNYVNGPNNCVSTSRFYSVCCIDECDGLLGHLEDQIASASAPAGLIAQLVSALPSATVAAPRQLDQALVQRLADIAVHHGGEVPLHGRLFAQWMHHAYPHECIYPHMSGTTKPMTQEQYLAHTGATSVKASEADKQNIMIESEKRADEDASVEGLSMWHFEEELFVGEHFARNNASWACTIRMVAFFAAMASMASALLPMHRKAVIALAPGESKEKYYV